MTVNAASLTCPFLSRVSSSFLGHAGASLNMYGQRCPIMARLFHRVAASGGHQGAKTLTLGEFVRWYVRNHV